jgi:probable HAF family extracellular repeat protein
VFPGVVATLINGINAPGRLVGTYVVVDGKSMPVKMTTHAFFENNGNFLTLDPDNIRSQGGSINAKGQVVGTYRDSGQKRHGFIWRNGAFTTFNVPGDDQLLGTVAFGINDIGEVVGDYVTAGDVNPDGTAKHRHGFLRSSEGAFTTIDVPDAVLTIGEGINNAGTIVGVYVLADGIHHGFVLKKGVFTTVDVKGQNTDINSINAKGEIVGAYFVGGPPEPPSNGVAHGFIGVPSH